MSATPMSPPGQDATKPDVATITSRATKSTTYFL